MRQVRRKFRQALKVFLQTRQHVVQGLSQSSHFDGNGLSRHALIELVRRDGLGSRLHGPQRRQARPRNQPAEQAAQHGRKCQIGPKGRLQGTDEIGVVVRVQGSPYTQVTSQGIMARNQRTQCPIFLLPVAPRCDRLQRKAGRRPDQPIWKPECRTGEKGSTRSIVDLHMEARVVLQ